MKKKWISCLLSLVLITSFASTIPVRLPDSAVQGVYEVRAIVQSQNARDERLASFSVK